MRGIMRMMEEMMNEMAMMDMMFDDMFFEPRPIIRPHTVRCVVCVFPVETGEMDVETVGCKHEPKMKHYKVDPNVLRGSVKAYCDDLSNMIEDQPKKKGSKSSDKKKGKR